MIIPVNILNRDFYFISEALTLENIRSENKPFLILPLLVISYELKAWQVNIMIMDITLIKLLLSRLWNAKSSLIFIVISNLSDEVQAS